MESKILSVNKSYESELQKLLAPAVGDKQNWKLCYRHSTDDDLSSSKSVFHSKCDGKLNTVIIVKVGEYVFGGYSDIAWGNNFSCIVFETGRGRDSPFYKPYKKDFAAPKSIAFEAFWSSLKWVQHLEILIRKWPVGCSLSV